MTHGDYACDVDVDFIWVVEHRLIAAEVGRDMNGRGCHFGSSFSGKL